MPAASTTASSLDDLHRALDAALGYGPAYRVDGMWLSSHLPMVLTALWRLEAPPTALQGQLALWAPQLPAAEPMPSRTRPLCEVLDERLPNLLDAPESAAFHGAIRLAYALEAGHAGELEAALRAWESAGPPLGAPPPAGAGDRSLREVLDAVRADAGLAFTPSRRQTIMNTMRDVLALSAFGTYLPQPRLSLDGLAEASLAVYLASFNFSALHLVTGLHALRVLLESRPGLDQGQVLRCAWRAWLAIYVAIGRPAPDWAAVHAGRASEEDWRGALPALHASANDHRIKLADAAREEWRHRGWPGYAQCLQARGAAA